MSAIDLAVGQLERSGFADYWHPLPHPPIDPADEVEHDTGWSGCCRG